MTRGVLIAVALGSVASTAAAQPVADVGLIMDHEPTDEAFLEFVPVPPERRYSDSEAARQDETVAFVVDLRAGEGVVRVWRRSDRATLERGLEVSDPDGVALAVMASELLEVARAGSMAEVVAVDPPDMELLDAEEATADPPAPVAASEPAPVARARFAFTVGAALEAWGSPERDAPWLIQPALALELAYTPPKERWQLAVGIFAAGLGQLTRSVANLMATYQRYDGGARLTFGAAVGPARTRLLGHARAGASVVVGRAEDRSMSPGQEGSEAVGAWFLGGSAEARQPLIEGLEITLELGADALIEPVAFTAAGVEVVRERGVRLSARLGVAYRVE